MDSVGANDNFIEILKSHFAFGIRINSPIEIMRSKEEVDVIVTQLIQIVESMNEGR